VRLAGALASRAVTNKPHSHVLYICRGTEFIMSGRSERRHEIAQASIRIVAASGVRALTHRAVDKGLELPPGSTSFYARSRRSLLLLAADELAARARVEFAGSGLQEPTAPSVDLEAVADGIAHFLDRMLDQHRHDIVARYALALEVRTDPELSEILASATFSQPAAERLMRALNIEEPAAAAVDLISLLEGLLVDHVIGRRQASTPTTRHTALQRAIHHFLRGLPRTPTDD
jgi:DNA-binding transcriptional regulator YbjK